MSKVGFSPVSLPDKVEAVVSDRAVEIKGPLGNLSEDLPRGISVSVEESTLKVDRRSEHWKMKAAHGLTRALIANMVKGVVSGWEKSLEMVGTGYRARLEGKDLVLSVGYSHPVKIVPPTGIQFSLDGQTKIIVKGIDKQVVGQLAAKIRAVRPPEPYKGKGIRYEGEQIRRKAGKAAKA